MKKIIGLMICIGVVSSTHAQVDTTKPVNKRPPGILDTIPPAGTNPMDSAMGKWPKKRGGDTMNNDSAGTYNHSMDTAALMGDSLARRDGWQRKDTVTEASMLDKTPEQNNNQNDSLNKAKTKMDSAVVKVDSAINDRVMMKDGEVFVIKKGEATKLEKDFTLPSGLVVTPDGTVKKKDGTAVKLKDGQYIEIKALPVKKDAPASKEKSVEKKAPVRKKKG